jgi:hypothetical protein
MVLARAKLRGVGLGVRPVSAATNSIDLGETNLI